MHRILKLVTWRAITNLGEIGYIQNKIAYLFIIHNLIVLVIIKCYVYAITYLIICEYVSLEIIGSNILNTHICTI